MNQVLHEHIFPEGTILQLVNGDLAEEQVDAIVNAANEHLQHGGGLAAAISRQGGPSIQAESDAWVREHGPVSHEAPAVTGGGKLPCRYVIHAVGPVWDGRNPQQKDRDLAAAVRGSLERAEALHLRSIAIPAISTGIFGFPKERAGWIILEAIIAYFAQHPGSSIRQVRLTLYDDPTLAAFLIPWREAFPP